jgi:hypothetical protein
MLDLTRRNHAANALAISFGSKAVLICHQPADAARVRQMRSNDGRSTRIRNRDRIIEKGDFNPHASCFS